VDARFGPFGESANFVCAELTAGSKIILDTEEGDMGHVESHFSPFADSVTIGAR
jgi:hypothetical protein